jgi:homoserine dehydrogenase
MFYGQGAGKLATASAVVSDVMEAARAQRYIKSNCWEAGGENVVFSAEEITSRWYARLESGASVPGAKELHTHNAPEGEQAWITDEALRPSQIHGLLEGREVKALYRVLE